MIKLKASFLFSGLCLTSQGNLVIKMCLAGCVLLSGFPGVLVDRLNQTLPAAVHCGGCKALFLLRTYTSSPFSKRKPEITACWGMSYSS